MNTITFDITVEVIAGSCPTSVRITSKAMQHEGCCRAGFGGISDYVETLAREWADMLWVESGDLSKGDLGTITLETPE